VGLALLSHFAVAKVYYVILDDIGTILFRIWAPTPKIPREHNDCLAFLKPLGFNTVFRAVTRINVSTIELTEPQIWVEFG